MLKQNRRSVWLILGAAALVTAPAAFAGLNGFSGKALEKLREKSDDQGQQQSAPAPAPQQQPAPPRQRSSNDRPPSQQAPRDRGPSDAPRQGGDPRGESRGGSRGGDAGVVGGAFQRNFGTGGSRGGNDGRGNGGHDGGYGNGGHYDRDHARPPRTVHTLPRGYRNYNWNGRPYYAYRGSWYRPYGGSYISIGVPYGLFVSSLNGGYSSFWFGNTRYFYSDDTYYTYEPVRRGYVVARSPYDNGRDDEDYDDNSAVDEDLFIYPARGQSEQQQADDRYECHRWAAKESNYDPIDDEYDPADRADYLRAMTACLTGRGYSVK
jgi:hypothetical protein